MKQALRDALDDRGYDTLTPVQQAVLDPELEGKDLLVSAQTGSGKTLGFGLAIAPTLLEDNDRFERAAAPVALVIAPTRELALQVKRELSWLYAKAGAVLASTVGGMDMRDERRNLARGAHIVVSTPGRLRDHIMRGSIDLSQIKAVVLDEADEMLDLGFREDLEFILAESPETRQTLLFSATVPKSILGLAKKYQKDAERVVAKSENAQHSDIEYRAMNVIDRDVENAVINTLLYYDAPNAIVFGNTRATVNRLTTRLSNRGFKVVALSGELSQTERTHALQAMRDGRAKVCVATDVAARGIDLPNLDLVVHAELPGSHETLLHRSGRTGRAGRKGTSALVVTKRNMKKAQRILSMAKLKAEWGSAPSAAEVSEREQERIFTSDEWTQAVTESEQPLVTRLTTEFSIEQIAAAYTRLRQSLHSAPEELSVFDDKPRPREEFGASVWFSIEGGRAMGAEPRRILPMLCKAGGLTKDDIGAIRVQKSCTYVQILESSASKFRAAIGPDMVVEDGAAVTQLAETPVLERPERSERPRKNFDRKPGGKPAHRGKRDFAPDQDAAGKADGKPKKPKGAGKPAEKPARRYSDEEWSSASKKGGKRPGKTPKGPPPPAGKANSKKNKARAKLRAEGGQSAPRRKG
ncbi:DEAD/DEAH box helicase [Cognatishimia sp. SS12]|uniref:DEAD/DEAH box helicase n=1 Tax=Cognatishimia sp. SS12 TaxID=2979465 RepID=UPI00232A80FB|nr:DEAD/DEAH box helicase [Cognatishimia sp. SS12]MDC0738740.1 DEAD/DEAH box helicase [Cognatishimia sp. SS12]